MGGEYLGPTVAQPPALATLAFQHLLELSGMVFPGCTHRLLPISQASVPQGLSTPGAHMPAVRQLYACLALSTAATLASACVSWGHHKGKPCERGHTRENTGDVVGTPCGGCHAGARFRMDAHLWATPGLLKPLPLPQGWLSSGATWILFPVPRPSTPTTDKELHPGEGGVAKAASGTDVLPGPQRPTHSVPTATVGTCRSEAHLLEEPSSHMSAQGRWLEYTAHI